MKLQRLPLCMTSFFQAREYLSPVAYLLFILWNFLRLGEVVILSILLPLILNQASSSRVCSLSAWASAQTVRYRSLYCTQEAEKLTIDLEHFHPKLYSYVLLFSFYYKLQWQVQKAHSNWGINKALKIMCLILQPIKRGTLGSSLAFKDPFQVPVTFKVKQLMHQKCEYLNASI